MISSPVDIMQIASQTKSAWDAGWRLLQPWRYAETDKEHISVLLNTFNPPRGARVLDVGCGFGETTRLMSKQRRDLKFVLLNIVQEQLDLITDTCEKVLGDAHDLPFENEEFDAVMFNAALCNMDARVALAEASRVLKPGGILYLNELLLVDGDTTEIEQWVGARAYNSEALIAFAKTFGLEFDNMITPQVAINYLRNVAGDDVAYDAAFSNVRPCLWRFIRKHELPIAAQVARTIAKHDRIALQFSGGKDSLTTLYLLRPWWDRLTVYWLNTGDAYPEMVERMSQIAKEVPHFVEVKGNQPEKIIADGWPADVVPHLNTTMGNTVFGTTEFKVQSRLDCCWHSLMLPMHVAMHREGITLAIRGKRNEEADRTGIQSGHIDNGMELLFPIIDWSADDVFNYLKSEGVTLPDYYNYATSSLDCMHCTAWLEHKNGSYLEVAHPVVFVEYKRRLDLIKVAITEQMKDWR